MAISAAVTEYRDLREFIEELDQLGYTHAADKLYERQDDLWYSFTKEERAICGLGRLGPYAEV